MNNAKYTCSHVACNTAVLTVWLAFLLRLTTAMTTKMLGEGPSPPKGRRFAA